MTNSTDIGYGSLDSPVGTLFLAATDAGLVRVGFECEEDDLLLADLARRTAARVVRTPRRVDHARRQLAEYFDGARTSFELALDWRLTAGFRRKVLDVTAAIPFGSTRTYREVAGSAGNAAAVRAAGSALATNPLPIVVPCHRVLRTDGGLGGFRGGLDTKRALLEFESRRAIPR